MKMTYKETLFFIGQSLTINHEEKNKVVIEKQLKKGAIDWDAVVKVSTSHYVFPALYCNFKRAQFLHYLPEDLVQYMQHITDLNRERNEKIIAQAKEINTLLFVNNVTPIFLKGTSNLLVGLYEDIAERMVGDIDFIVAKKEYEKTIEILLKFNYETVIKDNYHYPLFRHYARLHKINNIASVEIHKEMIIEKYADVFNYTRIKNDILFKHSYHFLSYENQLNLVIIAKQINDKGHIYKNISLRNTYDLFLLSKKTDAKKAITSFPKLQEDLNNFLAASYEVKGKINSLKYHKTEKTINYLKIFYKYLNNNGLREKHLKITSRKLFVLERLEFIRKSFFIKEYRQWMLKRVKDKQWQSIKLTQIGIKKR